MEGANLTDTDLTGANFTGANLRGASLIGAKIDRIILCDTVMPTGELDNSGC